MRYTSLVAVNLAALSLTHAEVCNPLKLSDCSPNQALGTDVAYDFSSIPSNWNITSFPERFTFDSTNGMTLTIAEKLNNPSILSNFYIMFGRVEAHIQAAAGTGVISSFFLQLDDLDEIDVELVSGDQFKFQLNFFSKGFTGNYDRGAFHATTGSISERTHNYTIVWTENAVEWWYEGVLARSLPANSPQGFPQSPMRIFIGLWAGGDSSNSQGTIEWAGGITDYSKGPFNQYVRLMVVNDYSSGTEYKYSDKLGLWSSIIAVNGAINNRINHNMSPVVDSTSFSTSISPSLKVSNVSRTTGSSSSTLMVRTATLSSQTLTSPSLLTSIKPKSVLSLPAANDGSITLEALNNSIQSPQSSNSLNSIDFENGAMHLSGITVCVLALLLSLI